MYSSLAPQKRIAALMTSAVISAAITFQLGPALALEWSAEAVAWPGRCGRRGSRGAVWRTTMLPESVMRTLEVEGKGEDMGVGLAAVQGEQRAGNVADADKLKNQ